MGHTHRTRRIAASPEALFRAFTNPTIVADWMEADAVVDQRGPLDAAGSTYTLVIAGPWRFRSRVGRSEPPRAFEAEGRGLFGTAYRMAASLRPDGDGTELGVDTEWTLPSWPIGRWMDRRWVQPASQGEDDRELDRLVDIVTGHDDASPRIVVRRGRRDRERALAAAKAGASLVDCEAPV
jgi:Polyketide cyclase / dehydrase and lipid transport